MRRLPGQAALGVAMLLHRLCTLAITLAVLGGVGAAAIAWRLSQGPVDLAWFTTRLEDAANADGGPTRLAIGSAALAWEGFRLGVDRPLDLRLTDVTVTDQCRHAPAEYPAAPKSRCRSTQLLFGRVVPRAVTLDAPQLTLVRATDGTISLDLGSLTETADSGEADGGDAGYTDHRRAGAAGAPCRHRPGAWSEQPAGTAQAGSHP